MGLVMTQCGWCGEIFGHLEIRTQEIVGELAVPESHYDECEIMPLSLLKMIFPNEVHADWVQ